jgi:hypothetical protein
MILVRLSSARVILLAMKLLKILIVSASVIASVLALTYVSVFSSQQTAELGRFGSFDPVASNDPPKDFQRAICEYSFDSESTASSDYEYCLVKINPFETRLSVSVWWPPIRESGRIHTYVGDCLNTGCQMIGPDYDYADDPRRYILSRTVNATELVFELRDILSSASCRFVVFTSVQK